MIFTFYKEYLEKLMAMFSSFDFAPPIAKASVKPSAKQKLGCLISLIKQTKE